MPLALAFLLGLASACGFAPLELWPLTILAFAGLLALIERAGALRRALALGWWFGMGQFALGLNWIATAFTYQAAMPAWLGWIAVALLSLYLALYPAIAAGLAWRWGARERLRLALLLAAAWIVSEWLRATMFTGFAWNPVGVIWAGAAPAARWIGTYGLSGLTVLAGGATWLAGGRRWRDGLLAALPVAAGLACGALVLAAPDARPAGSLIRIVQPNIGQDQKWREDFARANFTRLARLSGTPGAEPRLLLWPEAATPDFLEEQPLARARLAALLGPRDMLLLGGIALIGDRQGNVVAARNSLFALDPRGNLRGRYDKAHLVPYGEYLPMRPILSAIGLSRLAPGDLDFEPGPGARTLTLPGFGKVGVQICYEIIFSGRVIHGLDRPTFLFNPSNDAWFGAWGPPQHLAQARLRAAEEGLPVIRATPTGISAVIDARGALIERLRWRTAGAIETHLPASAPLTLFARFGNILPMLLAVALAGWAIAIRPKRR